MSSLSTKSAAELSKLLDEYRIKHGPIVDTTRKLYEKKLTEAMAKGTKPPSSDKTYYREEQEEIEYVTYHSPLNMASHNVSRQITPYSVFGFCRTRRSRIAEDDIDNADEPIISRTQTTYQSAPRFRPAYPSKSSQQDTSSVPAKSEASKSGGVPGWLRVLVFVVIAVFLYFVYSNMESAEQSPFGKIDS
ncbi:emerin [Astyanax mexicanus]|uniref:Emerin n=1 Tax=Astyanax mexicanus TaxID=7994 RepID=A0A8T2LIC3_ASTMX|nr:emerin [Astyanax mexicanus]